MECEIGIKQFKRREKSMNETQQKKPIKRRKELQALSRDHHFGLLLGWKIREGFRKEVEPTRIKNYVTWFWTNHLNAHFQLEEKWLFPVLGKDHVHIKRALAEHRRIKRLIKSNEDLVKNLNHIEEELEEHIRFEERILFQELQLKMDEMDSVSLEKIEDALSLPGFSDEYTDEFWKS